MIDSINYVKRCHPVDQIQLFSTIKHQGCFCNNLFVSKHNSTMKNHFLTLVIMNIFKSRFWMVNVCAEILCISSLAIFPAVSQNWANSPSMELTHSCALPYFLSSEFPTYHFIINFSIIQRRGVEPTCNLGENREVCARGYIFV